MGIVQDYLNSKKTAHQPVWVVKSTRDGVSLPIERKVYEIRPIKRTVFGNDWSRVENGECLRLDGAGFPYEVDMWNCKNSGSDSGYGSGLGDLWVWTYTTFKSKFSALRYYKEEGIRVKNKYGK